MTNDQYEVLKSHCNKCLLETNHHVIAKHEECGADDVYAWSQSVYILKCCGCNTLAFRDEFGDSESEYYDGEQFHPDIRVLNYPPASKRRLPVWLIYLPHSIRALLEEIYAACAADGRTLAAMGIRTVIDEFCKIKVGDVGNFRKKLEALEAGQFISSVQCDFIDAVLEAGHAASHRAYRPSAYDLNRLLDIIEHQLQAGFVLQEYAAEVRSRTPPRLKDNDQ